MLCAAIKDCPVFGGKLKSYDEAKIAGMPGVRKVVKVKDSARRGRRRHLVAREDRARRPADRWEEGAGASQSSATIAEHLKEGLTATATNGERQNGDAPKAIETAAEKGRGGLQHALPLACVHGDDERHGAARGR